MSPVNNLFTVGNERGKVLVNMPYYLVGVVHHAGTDGGMYNAGATVAEGMGMYSGRACQSVHEGGTTGKRVSGRCQNC